jgi:hypothetical protein
MRDHYVYARVDPPAGRSAVARQGRTVAAQRIGRLDAQASFTTFAVCRIHAPVCVSSLEDVGGLAALMLEQGDADTRLPERQAAATCRAA